MKSFAFFAIVAVIIGSSLSFRLESLEENTSDDRIVGGATAKAGQFPYQASIRHPEVQTIIPPNKPLIFVHHCGGSIISDRLVVTTARCMQGLHGMTRYTEIVLGAHHIHKDGDHYQVSQIINHPAYNSNHDFKNDISLLQTNTSIQFNNHVKSIPLSMQFMDGGVRSTISGWGNVQVMNQIVEVSKTKQKISDTKFHYYYVPPPDVGIGQKSYTLAIPACDYINK